MEILLILFFLLGITLTSFYQLLAERLPVNKTILGRSECDNCHKTLRFIDIFPIFGYIINHGKCHKCKKPINIKYPLTELLGGLLFSLMYYVLGLDIELIAALTMISVLLIETLTDINSRTVLDKIWIIGLIIIIPIRIIQGTFFEHLLSASILFFFLWGLSYFGYKILNKTALGGGDIKLYIFIGFILTIWSNILSLFLASVLALIYAISFKKTKEYIPLVPFIALSVVITYFFGNQLIDWYLGLFGM
ncbi:MAG: prepilin peptidase [Tenericutes bacterium]|nr:prepilin peptidase [Mycoplasmatota bacterium]